MIQDFEQITLFDAAIKNNIDISAAGLTMFKPGKIDKYVNSEKIKKRFNLFKNKANNNNYSIHHVIYKNDSLRVIYTDVEGVKYNYVIWDDMEHNYNDFEKVDHMAKIIEYAYNPSITHEQKITLETIRHKYMIAQVIKRNGDKHLYVEVDPYVIDRYFSSLVSIEPDGTYSIYGFYDFSYDNDEVLEKHVVDYKDSFLKTIKDILSLRLKTFASPSRAEHYYSRLNDLKNNANKYSNVEISDNYSEFKTIYEYLTSKGFFPKRISLYNSNENELFSQYALGGYEGTFILDTGFGIVVFRIFKRNAGNLFWDLYQEHAVGVDFNNFAYGSSINSITDTLELFCNCLNDFIDNNCSIIEDIKTDYHNVYSIEAPWDINKIKRFCREGKFVPNKIKLKYHICANVLSTLQKSTLRYIKKYYFIRGRVITFIANDYLHNNIVIEYIDDEASTRGTSVLYIKKDGTTRTVNDTYVDVDAPGVILFNNRVEKSWSEQNKALDKFKKEYKESIRRIIKREGSSNIQIEYRDKRTNNLNIADMHWDGSIYTYTDVNPLVHIHMKDIIFDNSADDIEQLSLI